MMGVGPASNVKPPTPTFVSSHAAMLTERTAPAVTMAPSQAKLRRVMTSYPSEVIEAIRGEASPPEPWLEQPDAA